MFLLTAVWFITLLFPGNLKSTEKPQPVIQKGVLDLSDWDFENGGLFNIRGESEFYWNRLIAVNAFQKGTVGTYPVAGKTLK